MSVSENERVEIETSLNFEKALLETESLRLDFQGLPPLYVGILIATSYTHGNRVLDTRFPCEFHVNAKWKISHIRSDPNIKPSLKDSIYSLKIESLRLEMLVCKIHW